MCKAACMGQECINFNECLADIMSKHPADRLCPVQRELVKRNPIDTST